MKWSLQQLQKLYDLPFEFKESLDFTDYLETIKNNDSEIKDVKNTKVVATINRIDFETYSFKYNIQSDLLLSCALTLEPVSYSMNLEVEEVYSTRKDLDDEDIFPFEGNTVDTKVVVWGNIVANIPIRVVRDDAYDILKSRGIILDEDIPDEE